MQTCLNLIVQKNKVNELEMFIKGGYFSQLRRDFVMSVSSKDFYQTGLYPDIVQVFLCLFLFRLCISVSIGICHWIRAILSIYFLENQHSWKS